MGLEAQGTIPHLLFMAYQGTFAIITAALISGAIVERMRFGPYLAFLTLWGLFVYAPVAHWVWGGGFLAKLGALDFAGGTVVHVNAGAAALVAALVLGPRKDYGRQAILPHNVAFTVLGAGPALVRLVRLQRRQRAGRQRLGRPGLRQHDAGPGGDAGGVDAARPHERTGKATAVGAATGIVVGLVAVTPAAGFVSPLGAIALGALAAFPSYYGLLWRARTRLDDSLDVVAAHGVGGTVGALLTGVLASKAWNGATDGLLFGNPRQLVIQAVAVARRHRLQRGRHLRPAQAGRPRRAPAGDGPRRGPGPRREPAR